MPIVIALLSAVLLSFTKPHDMSKPGMRGVFVPHFEQPESNLKGFVKRLPKSTDVVGKSNNTENN